MASTAGTVPSMALRAPPNGTAPSGNLAQVLGAQGVHPSGPVAGAALLELAELLARAGVRTFARGEMAALGGTFHAVSVPALELTPEQFAAIPVRYVNGREGRYDQAPAQPDAI